MKKRMILMLAGLLFGQVAAAHAAGTRRALAQAETAQKVTSVADIIPVCERAMDEAFRSLPTDQRGAAISICVVYLAGAASMLKRLRGAPALPAGGKSI